MIQTSADTFTLPAALPLQDGGLLFNACLAYESYGRLTEGNGVMVLHDLVHSHRALGLPEPSKFRPSGWGTELIGEGKPLSPASWYVVSPNLLGSPFGSTSPVTVDSITEEPIGGAFPSLSVEDMARGVAALARGLRIKRLRALVGIGLGGMVALRAAALFPQMTGGVVALGAARSLPEGVRDYLGSVGQLLREDPEYQDGNYGRRGGPRRALEQLRLEYVRRIHPRPQGPEQEREQVAEAHAFASELDANAYALLCDALARCDLTNVLDRITAKVLLVASSSDALVPPSRVLDTYHQLTAEGVNARFYEMQTDGGHPALLTEAQKLRGPITEFLASIS